MLGNTCRKPFFSTTSSGVLNSLLRSFSHHVVMVAALVAQLLKALFGDGLFLFCRCHGGDGEALSSLAEQVSVLLVLMCISRQDSVMRRLPIAAVGGFHFSFVASATGERAAEQE